MGLVTRVSVLQGGEADILRHDGGVELNVVGGRARVRDTEVGRVEVRSVPARDGLPGRGEVVLEDCRITGQSLFQREGWMIFGSVALERCIGQNGDPVPPFLFPVERGIGAQITVDGLDHIEMPSPP